MLPIRQDTVWSRGAGPSVPHFSSMQLCPYLLCILGFCLRLLFEKLDCRERWESRFSAHKVSHSLSLESHLLT